MKAHHIDTHLLVPRSSAKVKVKVKYQGHVSQKMGVLGALVFHKHILFSFGKGLTVYQTKNFGIYYLRDDKIIRMTISVLNLLGEKTLCGKEKMLVCNNLSFSRNVFLKNQFLQGS